MERILVYISGYGSIVSVRIVKMHLKHNLQMKPTCLQSLTEQKSCFLYIFYTSGRMQCVIPHGGPALPSFPGGCHLSAKKTGPLLLHGVHWMLMT